MDKIKLIIGLGNPSKEYKHTRHNVGFLFIDIAEDNFKNKKIIFAKTEVFMNESGKAVANLLNIYKVKPENLLIVHDDIDILWRKFKFSFNRSSAGHKGVESIIKTLKTKNFWRLRIGIQPIRPASQKLQRGEQAHGKPNTRIKAEKIILKKFTEKEMVELRETVKKAVSELETAF